MSSVLVQDTLALTFAVSEIQSGRTHVSDGNDGTHLMFFFLFEKKKIVLGDVIFCVSCIVESTFWQHKMFI
jgi:hypothetical protein